jgi:nitrite reductase/ring-hydroxylating ferredoxin subunit
MADYVAVAKVSDIAPGQIKAYEVDGVDIAVANVDGTFHAFSNFCTHQGADFAHGFGEVFGNDLVCLLHDSAFNLQTGESIDGPAYDPLPIYSVRVEGDDVLVSKDGA